MLLLALASSTFVLRSNGEEARWLSNPQKAAALAASSGKRLLVLFSDTEHCPACAKLEREILTTAAFSEYAEKELALLHIPCDLRTNKAADVSHERLRSALDVEIYPTWWLLDQDLCPMLSGGYVPGGSEAFIEQLSQAERTSEAESAIPVLRELFN